MSRMYGMCLGEAEVRLKTQVLKKRTRKQQKREGHKTERGVGEKIAEREREKKKAERGNTTKGVEVGEVYVIKEEEEEVVEEGVGGEGIITMPGCLAMLLALSSRQY